LLLCTLVYYLRLLAEGLAWTIYRSQIDIVRNQYQQQVQLDDGAPSLRQDAARVRLEALIHWELLCSAFFAVLYFVPIAIFLHRYSNRKRIEPEGPKTIGFVAVLQAATFTHILIGACISTAQKRKSYEFAFGTFWSGMLGLFQLYLHMYALQFLDGGRDQHWAASSREKLNFAIVMGITATAMQLASYLSEAGASSFPGKAVVRAPFQARLWLVVYSIVDITLHVIVWPTFGVARGVSSLVIMALIMYSVRAGIYAYMECWMEDLEGTGGGRKSLGSKVVTFLVGLVMSAPLMLVDAWHAQGLTQLGIIPMIVMNCLSFFETWLMGGIICNHPQHPIMDDWGCLCAASDTDLDTLRYCGGPDPQQKTAEDKTADRVFLVWISLLWILKSTSMIILYRISKRKKLPPTKVLATPEDTSAPKKSNRKKQSNQSSRRARHFPSKPEPPLNPLPDDLQGMRIGQSRVVS